MLPLPASHDGEHFPWPSVVHPQGNGTVLLLATYLWKAPSKILPPVLQPASLQAKLPFIVKAEVLIQALFPGESAKLLFGLLGVLKGRQRWKNCWEEI